MLVERVSVQPSSQNNHQVPQEAKHLVNRLRDRSGTQVRRITATLLPPQPRFAYQRHVGDSEIWPRRYTAEDFSISIQVERGTSRRDSLQLIGLSRAGGQSWKRFREFRLCFHRRQALYICKVSMNSVNFVFIVLRQPIHWSYSSLKVQ